VKISFNLFNLCRKAFLSYTYKVNIIVHKLQQNQNMIALFHITYGTKSGEQIAIQFKRKQVESTIICQSYDATHWQGVLEVEPEEAIEYKYVVQSFKGMLAEQGTFRQLTIPKGQNQVFYQDEWRAEYEPERTFFSAAFKDVIFKRDLSVENTFNQRITHKNRFIFQLYAAFIPQDCVFGVIGNTAALGNWKKPLLLSAEKFPLWQVDVELDAIAVDIAYKFVIYNPNLQTIVSWEKGENRHCTFTFPSLRGNTLVRTDESFRYNTDLWRGAGVAIPVFSLRSETGLGIGEFTDIQKLVDWAVQIGMKLVQILPVNDTIATQTWADSYPYAAISVFALHPLYVNIQKIAPLKDSKAHFRLEKAILELNLLDSVDFEAVLKIKFEFFKRLFEQEKIAFFQKIEVLRFINANADWLKPYAAFCHLRDIHNTTNFYEWKKYSTFSQEVIDDLCTPDYAEYDKVALYYFIQFHAHQQLTDTVNYARSQGVVLKGDLPIGIYRHSCDAWVAPHLYNMDGQAGAPPDAYAVAGQNWGFPTYNWEGMAADNFAWWRQRMTKLSEYFDALRIDHILGFFRIWQIPTNQVEGTLGLFNPRLPYSRQELAQEGLQGNLDRYTKPYIRGHFLAKIFGQDADYVRETFLDEIVYNEFKLKPFVDNQLKIKQLFLNDLKYASKKHLVKGLMSLVGEVLLLEEHLNQTTVFNPRITVHSTYSYKELDHFGKYIINRLYDDYYFQRHDDFWKQQALWKLPALIKATNMFICGEDLGMIPKSVPGVMTHLNIIGLEIQRMPKGKTDFGEPATYPYMSVCSPSCHDMSTIRGWWESDAAIAQLFYEKSLKKQGKAPATCTADLVEAVNQQHFDAPSIWAVFPIQDLVGMDQRLRRKNAAEEQINEPSNPQHYWRFRFHLSLEQLLKERDLNRKIQKMVQASGRGEAVSRKAELVHY
jgi:4-alpha-glucanotransferase